MSAFSAIDLSAIPAPSITPQITFEQIIADMIADLKQRDPNFTALVESDPAYAVMEVCAYRELLLRQSIQDGGMACMLAYSTGANLEQLAGLFGVTRKITDLGNPAALPPIPPTYESDTSLRFRSQLALEGLSTAGPVGAYIVHALSVEGVLDVGVQGPPDTDPGTVAVTVLANAGSGAASPALITAVQNALNADTVRPLTDNVVVQSASIQNYSINAKLSIYDGPDPDVVIAAATAALQSYLDSRHKVGFDVRLTGIYAALHVGGVDHVTLLSPGITADKICSATQAPHCTGITITTEVVTP